MNDSYLAVCSCSTFSQVLLIEAISECGLLSTNSWPPLNHAWKSHNIQIVSVDECISFRQNECVW